MSAGLIESSSEYSPDRDGLLLEDEAQIAEIEIALSKVALPESILSPLPKHSNTIELHKKDDKTVSRKRIAGRVALGAFMLVGGLAKLNDIDQNVLAPIVWANQTAEIHQLASTEYNAENPAANIVVFTGTGSKDPTEGVAVPLLPSFETIENSKVYVLEEGNTIHLPHTFELIDQMIAESPAKELILYGASAGGKQALLVAEYVNERWPDVHVTVILDSSPFDETTVFKLASEEMRAIHDLVTELKLHGGPLLRSIIDMIASRDKYTDVNGNIVPEYFWQEIDRNIRDVWQGERSTTQLYLDQVSISRIDPTNTLVHIGELTKDRQPTTVVYIAPLHDSTVQTNLAVTNYRDVITTTSMTFIVIPVNSEHAGARLYSDQYNEVLIPLFEHLKRANDLYDESLTTTPNRNRVGGI